MSNINLSHLPSNIINLIEEYTLGLSYDKLRKFWYNQKVKVSTSINNLIPIINSNIFCRSFNLNNIIYDNNEYIIKTNTPLFYASTLLSLHYGINLYFYPRAAELSLYLSTLVSEYKDNDYSTDGKYYYKQAYLSQFRVKSCIKLKYINNIFSFDEGLYYQNVVGPKLNSKLLPEHFTALLKAYNDSYRVPYIRILNLNKYVDLESVYNIDTKELINNWVVISNNSKNTEDEKIALYTDNVLNIE